MKILCVDVGTGTQDILLVEAVIARVGRVDGVAFLAQGLRETAQQPWSVFYHQHSHGSAVVPSGAPSAPSAAVSSPGTVRVILPKPN